MHSSYKQLFEGIPRGLNIRGWEDGVQRNRGQNLISTFKVGYIGRIARLGGMKMDMKKVQEICRQGNKKSVVVERKEGGEELHRYEKDNQKG